MADVEAELKEIQLLAHSLSRLDGTSKVVVPGEPGEWTLAYTLTEIRKSCRELCETLYPKLLQDQLVAQETLHDIGEELRHIIYHINTSDYYSYLQGSTDETDIGS